MEMYQFRRISTLTLMRREVIRVLRLWKQTIFPSIITTILYFSIFGVVLGSRVGTVDGVPYIEFVSPGLVMLAVITNTYSNTAFSVFIERFHRSLEELLSSPLSDHQIIWGFAAGGVFRGMVCGFTVWLTAFCFLGYRLEYPFFFIGSCFISSLVFALMGITNGFVGKTFDDLNVMTTFLLNPLVMLGGVFYSVSMLSPLWQKVALCNPLLYVGNLFRFCMIGVANIDPFFVLAILMVLIVVFYGLCLWLMRSTTYVRQ